jgi:HipA-like protein
LRGEKVGILTEGENGYTFEYDADYLTAAVLSLAIVVEIL